jgi:hypothetical protein
MVEPTGGFTTREGESVLVTPSGQIVGSADPSLARRSTRRRRRGGSSRFEQLIKERNEDMARKALDEARRIAEEAKRAAEEAAKRAAEKTKLSVKKVLDRRRREIGIKRGPDYFPEEKGINKFILNAKTQRRILGTKVLRGKKLTLRETASLLPLVLAESGGTAAKFGRDVKGNFVNYSKKPAAERRAAVKKFLNKSLEFSKKPAAERRAITKRITKALDKSVRGTGAQFGDVVRTRPGEATAIVAGQLVTLVGSTKAISALEKGGTALLGKAIAKDIKKGALGEKTIKNVKGVGDIEIIPPRGTKLDVDIPKAIKKAKVEKIFRETPKLPKPSSSIEKQILEVVKKKGDAISGSYAQEAILKKTFARRHKDLDILTKNRPALIKALKRKIGDKIKLKKKFRSVQVFYRGRQIADIVKFEIGEGGFAARFGIIKHNGLNIVNPKARLGGKLIQFKSGKKTKKVTKDIESLFAKEIDLDDPKFKGAFGFSKKELKAAIGKKGPIATAQINLLGRGILKPSQLKVKRWLYATPFNPKTGKAQIRVSRLGLGDKTKEATLLDILGYGDEISFAKNKPQIFVFPKEKIFSAPGKLSKAKTVRIDKGFVVPQFSGELEVVLGRGFAIKRGETLGRVNIQGKIVPIIEMKKVRLSTIAKKSISDLANKRQMLARAIATRKINPKKRARLVNEIKRQELNVARRLRSETGLDYGSTLRKGTSKYFSRKKLLASLSKLPASKSAIRRGLISRPTSPSISRGIPGRSPSKSPSRFRSPSKGRSPTSPQRPPTRTSPPIRPPGKPPITPPGRPVKRGTIGFFRLSSKRKKVFSEKGIGYNLYGKSHGKFRKLNRVPLTKLDAYNRGAYAIDNTTARTLVVRPAGRTKNFGKIKKKEQGYYSKKAGKFREFRIRRGKRKGLSQTLIEKRRFGIDTRGENRGLSIAKLIKREGYNRRTKRNINVRRFSKRRKINRGIFG